MEKARRGTKLVVVEMELVRVKEEYNERSETGVFNELELKTSFALSRQCMPM